jgi:hypothetical protein
MARKPILIRIDPALHEALQRWAEEELRSLNGQIEYLLRQAVLRRGTKLDRSSQQEQPPPPDSGEGS